LRTLFALCDGDGRGTLRCCTDASLRPEMHQLVAQAISECQSTDSEVRILYSCSDLRRPESSSYVAKA